ncbi:flagellar biosynthesis protein FlhF, partial [Bacillus nitratireducens]|nr:flagellar biosynthesis protein FlhF [Bacillus nitratireducens]
MKKVMAVVKRMEATNVKKKQPAVKQDIPVKKEELVVKKENQESEPLINQKEIRMIEKNNVEHYFIHSYAKILKMKFANATMIT